VVFVLVGFTVGDGLGVPAWVVAAIADAVLVAMTRWVPWRTVPVGAVVLAASLGILAAAAAPHLDLENALGPDAPGGDLRIVALAVVAANAINNLPAVLIGLPALGPDPDDRLWSLLLGVNMGPVLIVSGSLAGLLWLDTTRRLGVRVDARRYTSVGLRVGAPALLAAIAVLLATNLLAS
jgi:arsenical pump membrane protein